MGAGGGGRTVSKQWTATSTCCGNRGLGLRTGPLPRVAGVAREVQSSAGLSIHLYSGTKAVPQKICSAVHRGLQKGLFLSA